MGLFNRNNKESNAVQINEVSQSVRFNYTPWLFPHKKDSSVLGTVYLQSILNQLWRGINNITFTTTKKESLTVESIITFTDANATLLVSQYLRLGYMCVFYNDKKEYRLPQDSEIKTDQHGRVINKHAVVVYSPQYQNEKTSMMKISLPLVMHLNKLAGTESYLMETLGCFGVLTGQDIPINPAGKEQLLKQMQEQYGVADGKYKFMLANHDMKYINLQPDIKGLGIDDKLETNYKLLSNLFGVPLPLLFDTSATYNNVREARTYFYDNTIREYAETILKVAQALLTASNDYIPKEVLSYKFENVPELEKTLSSACEERSALLDYLLKLKAAGQDVDKQIAELVKDSESLFKSK